ncbi:oxidoreductase [Sphaerisporangium rufum]|uniref:Oxidoreductase n=1 Tax=Sphaerisporangium rufum TaxID=1381558 RepID=A0A919R534_9ACTN|nr:nitroreductase family protein [Sphaerisporangium rufum]GII78556.1 oxidoreductase [Sphaerisporangium rufum]
MAEPGTQKPAGPVREPLITDLETVLTTTRAVRRRLDLARPVPRELVLDCLRLALQAPTGGDAEDWRFVLVGDPATRARIGEEYRRLFDLHVRPRLPALQAGATMRAGPPGSDPERGRDLGRDGAQDLGHDRDGAQDAGHDLDGAARRRRARVYAGAAYLAENIGRAPWLVLACATRPNRSPKIAAAVYGSVFPAVWSFQLALRSHGLGSIITTLHLRDPAEVTRILGIPDGVTQCALLPVAYTLGTDFRPAARRPVAEVTYLDQWARPLPAG